MPLLASEANERRKLVVCHMKMLLIAMYKDMQKFISQWKELKKAHVLGVLLIDTTMN